jgi:uncharacterized protein (DUF3820 family)
MLSKKEIALIRSALNPACLENEWKNAAVLFFTLVRNRVKDDPESFEFLQPDNANLYPITIPPTQPDYGLTEMPWGKHKGELFKDISPNYLQWALNWIRQDKDRLAKMAQLASAISAFLGI